LAGSNQGKNSRHATLAENKNVLSNVKDTPGNQLSTTYFSLILAKGNAHGRLTFGWRRPQALILHDLQRESPACHFRHNCNIDIVASYFSSP
jgi:hypothetical protein